MEQNKIFEELNREYSLSQTTESRKTELLKLMQENLKQRCGKDSAIVKCMDDKDYSPESDNVSELYAIDAALKETEKRKDRDNVSDAIRAKELSKNVYSPDNPYPGK
ncbi:MAG: hypothetical protein J5565_05855 [Muribaculaceae bacterium]|nr:hypothetical protein [Muribaculaceae bacterium]